jgi:hypothetical protein
MHDVCLERAAIDVRIFGDFRHVAKIVVSRS